MNFQEIKSQYTDIPNILWEMFQKLDVYTYNHSIRVCEMAQKVEKILGFTDNSLSKAALFHDIGKYYISSKILMNPEELTPLERYIIDVHSYLSYYTCNYFKLPKNVCEITLYHHTIAPVVLFEPYKECKDNDIKRKSIILKTIDMYEAITTDRPYHRGLSTTVAAQEVAKTLHDADTLNILINSKEFNR